MLRRSPGSFSGNKNKRIFRTGYKKRPVFEKYTAIHVLYPGLADRHVSFSDCCVFSGPRTMRLRTGRKNRFRLTGARPDIPLPDINVKKTLLPLPEKLFPRRRGYISRSGKSTFRKPGLRYSRQQQLALPPGNSGKQPIFRQTSTVCRYNRNRLKNTTVTIRQSYEKNERASFSSISRRNRASGKFLILFLRIMTGKGCLATRRPFLF